MSGDMMAMPDKWEDFLHECEFKDKQEVYTNGSMLMPSFRVEQMMEAYLLPLKRQLIIAASELAVEKQNNLLLEANNEHFKAELGAAVRDLHSFHSLCMNIGGCCPECGAQIDELMDMACTFCAESGQGCWVESKNNESFCATFKWRGVPTEEDE